MIHVYLHGHSYMWIPDKFTYTWTNNVF